MGSLPAIIGPGVQIFPNPHLSKLNFTIPMQSSTQECQSHHYYLMMSTEVREFSEIEPETIFPYSVFIGKWISKGKENTKFVIILLNQTNNFMNDNDIL